jgi:hypothetical protein
MPQRLLPLPAPGIGPHDDLRLATGGQSNAIA